MMASPEMRCAYHHNLNRGRFGDDLSRSRVWTTPTGSCALTSMQARCCASQGSRPLFPRAHIVTSNPARELLLLRRRETSLQDAGLELLMCSRPIGPRRLPNGPKSLDAAPDDSVGRL